MPLLINCICCSRNCHFLCTPLCPGVKYIINLRAFICIYVSLIITLCVCSCNNIELASPCYGYEDHGIFLAGASDEIWKKGSACGRRYKVKCIGITNLARMVMPSLPSLITVDLLDVLQPLIFLKLLSSSMPIWLLEELRSNTNGN